MLFLELGCKPFREIIRERRLGFLYYILNEDPQSLIHKFFQTQLKNSSRGDWVTTVLSDLEYLNIKQSLETIKSMKKGSFMNIVKERIKNKCFQSLEKIKKSHSKVQEIKHNSITMQKHLKPNKTNESKQQQNKKNLALYYFCFQS